MAALVQKGKEPSELLIK
ncbi:hypothetical protein [Stenotrophomonas maltophilia]